MDSVISYNQQQFLLKIIPNALVFVNRFIEWPINDVKYLSKKDLKRIFLYLTDFGCYFPLDIDSTNYELDLLQEYPGIKVYNQKNIYKNTFLKIAILSKVMILDIDSKTLEELLELLKTNVDLNWRIYKTTNGHHAYCINRFFSCKDLNTLQTMKDFGCDEIYIHFCRKYDFVVRIERKYKEEPFIEKFQTELVNNTSNPQLKEITDVIKLKDVIVNINSI